MKKRKTEDEEIEGKDTVKDMMMLMRDVKDKLKGKIRKTKEEFGSAMMAAEAAKHDGCCQETRDS